MRFPNFYGNEALKKRLSNAQAQNNFSHFYILVGPAGSGKKTLATCMAAAIECTQSKQAPCGVCPDCHKIFAGGHPDVITVDSDKATVPIAVIREMCKNAYIRPNEGKRKIYFIPRAQDMQAPAQNALLKVLEEPPDYCVFILMTNNAEKILPTLRSRAVELTLSPLSDQELILRLQQITLNTSIEAISAAAEKSGGYLGAAIELLNKDETGIDQRVSALVSALCSRDELEFITATVSMEKLKRSEFLSLLQEFQLILSKAMARKSEATCLCSPAAQQLVKHCSRKQLFHASSIVQTSIIMLQGNVNCAHCVGYLLSSLTS